MNQDKSNDFTIVGVRNLTCLNLLLDPVDGLKFNIWKTKHRISL